MFRGFIDVFNILLWCSSIHVGSLFIMVVAIAYVIQTTTPIETHYTTVQVNEPPKRVLVEREFFNRTDGCPIVNNVCLDCITLKN